MKSSGQRSVPGPRSGRRPPTDPSASTRSHPASASARRFATWSIRSGSTYAAASPWRWATTHSPSGRPAPRSELPAISASRAIRRAYPRVGLDPDQVGRMVGAGGRQTTRRRNEMSEDQLATSKRVIEEAFNEGNLDVVDQVCAENWVGHDPL